MTEVPPRKFLSEFAVSLFSARWLMVTPSDLMKGGEVSQEAAEVAQRCHIYLICRRPAQFYDPKNFKYDGGKVSGTLAYKIAGRTEELYFELPFEPSDGATTVRLSDYPHREIEACSSDGECIRRVPASMMTHLVAPSGVLRQLDVLYVGQAYADGRRSAFERLKDHSTLQRILADVVQSMPDDEVLLLTFEYEPYQIIGSIDGAAKEAIRDETDAARFPRILDNPLTEKQQICLVEAGLIRYFNPQYNEVYKNSFPSEDQKILAECYALDFSALVVEIDTTELRMELFSHSVAASDHHIAEFDLVDPERRRSFFTFVNEDD